MEQAIQIVKASARDHHLHDVTDISMVAGALAGVNVDALRFAFEVLKADDPVVAHSSLEITEEAGTGVCPRCGETSPVWHFDLRCPRCGFLPMETVGGDALYVKSISGGRCDG
ncbi:MAG: hydrogenase maturation nickel metallochaperone HypA [Armatimonadetes bacterium]|nr:hydrogenase maturation nickel metallochaperone HypA [Armatimonadota bacterium]